jgi:hypothetical protein
MSLLIWQRMVQSTKLAGCLDKAFIQGAVAAAKAHKGPLPRLVSARKVPFAHLRARAAAFHVLMHVPTTKGDVRVMAETVVIGRGRTPLPADCRSERGRALHGDRRGAHRPAPRGPYARLISERTSRTRRAVRRGGCARSSLSQASPAPSR